MNRAIESNCYYYDFYGIKLQVNRQLAGFTAVPDPSNTAKDKAEIVVDLFAPSSVVEPQILRLQNLTWTPIAENIPRSRFCLSKARQDEATYYRIQRIIKGELIEYIFNSDGSKIWGRYSHEMLWQDTVSLLLGYVLGNVIRLRGHLAFHASAIAIENRAILLTGNSGAGKSTTAAALSRRGLPILADDIAVLKRRSAQYWVQPGYPRLRLLPKSVKAFDTSPQELTKVSSFGYKRYLNLTAARDQNWLFQDKPLPLGAIYVLGERDNREKSSVEPLVSSAAMTTAVQSVYGSYFLEPNIRRDEFQQLAQFVRQVPIRKLSRPNDLANLSQLCSLIVEDIQALFPKNNANR